MSEEREPFTLPIAPKGLCFDKNYFLKCRNNLMFLKLKYARKLTQALQPMCKENRNTYYQVYQCLSVDTFLHEHRNVASLENMRDDLGAYLKVLRMAMIELINKDYANFVNLSATLIGLDKAIIGIQSPLGQLREQVIHVKNCLDEAMKELSLRLEQREILRKKKRDLQYYSETLNSLKTLKAMLKIGEYEDADIPSDVVDRAAAQFNQLQFTIGKCNALMRPDEQLLCVTIGEKITQTLGEQFLGHVHSNNEEGIIRTLQIFASLDKISDVETLVKQKITAPALKDVITEYALQKNPNGLQGIYTNILNFLNTSFKPLLTITHHRNKSQTLKGYNFLVNSFWAELETRLEVHMASIFAPGNPKVFYSRYIDSVEFLSKLEMQCGDLKTVRTLREHAQYKSFVKKWNLPVYYQIRFQEIAGDFEETLNESIGKKSFEDGSIKSNPFLLKVTTSCWKSINICWMDGIFIAALLHRFWKLNLQIISRYTKWIDLECQQIKSTLGSADDNFTDTDVLRFWIFLYTDVNTLITKFPELIKTIANKKIEILQDTSLLEKSLQVSEEQLVSKLNIIKSCIVNKIYEETSTQLKQVSDIPRLYRKTNRNVPNAACTYVTVALTTITDFNKQYSQYIRPKVMHDWMETIFSTMTSLYYNSVKDVLTSVQKTEESLRRLKQIRESSLSQQIIDNSAGLSDGDKIRIQLQVDVTTYFRAVDELKLDVNKIDNLKEMVSLVEEAVKDIKIKE